MANPNKYDTSAGQDGYEHRDLPPSTILYFLLILGIAVVVALFGIRGLYSYLDHRERALQPEVNPLVTNIPADTRHITPGYPQTAFPNPRLEENERGQLNGFLTDEEKTLYSYGWADQQAGTVRIPIDRAMDLLVQRGLPVRPESADDSSAAKAEKSTKNSDQARKVNQDGKK
ncbi:MAG TPA: hypothetical protein VGG46_09180 [Terriglobales bacterium]